MYVEGGGGGGTLRGVRWGGGGGVRRWGWGGGGLLDVGHVEGVRWGEGTRWRGGIGFLVGARGSLGPRPWKTAQKPLKNRSNLA